MFTRKLAGVIAIAAAASFASAQSATVTLTAPSNTLPAGQTVTVTAQVTFDLAGAGAGAFGPAGFYGGGGDIVGTSATGVSISAASVDAQLDALVAPGMITGNNVDSIGGGRGLSSALPGTSATLLTFDVTAAPGASGNVTYTYDGAILLVRNDALETFSTNPGMGQSTLTVNPITLTIGNGPCNNADLAQPFGVLNFADVQSFLGSFGAGLPAADLAAPMGVFNFADVQSFLGLFGTGC